MVDAGLYIAYALTAIATLAFIGFELLDLFKNISESKNTLAAIGALILILVISYAVGSGDFTFPGIEKFGLSESGLKMVDAGLFATYILFALAWIALIADLVMGVVRR